MHSFIQLMTNEWLKLTKKKSFYIAFVLLIAIPIIYALFLTRVMEDTTSTNSELVKNLVDLTGTGSVLVILCMIVAASMVSKEHQLGTIKLLLIRAHSRYTILLSKYVILLLYMVLLMLFTIAVGILVSFIFLGLQPDNAWGDLAKSAVYTLSYTVIYMTIAFMLSVLTKSTGATIGIAFALMFFEGLFIILLSRYEAAKFVLFFNTDLSVYEAGSGPLIEGMTLGFSITVLAVYMAVMLAISFYTFRKRDVA